MKYFFCTVKFHDGRQFDATVKRSERGEYEPEKIWVNGEWIDFEEYEADDENAIYSVVDYRKRK